MDSSSQSIRAAVASLAGEMGFQFEWNTQDGYSWLEIEGDQVMPEAYRDLSQAIADKTGVSFYFANISCGRMEGALDWDFNTEARYTVDPDNEIEGYGTVFYPASAPRPRTRSLG